jgi:hypothetical protein
VTTVNKQSSTSVHQEKLASLKCRDHKLNWLYHPDPSKACTGLQSYQGPDGSQAHVSVRATCISTIPAEELSPRKTWVTCAPHNLDSASWLLIPSLCTEIICIPHGSIVHLGCQWIISVQILHGHRYFPGASRTQWCSSSIMCLLFLLAMFSLGTRSSSFRVMLMHVAAVISGVGATWFWANCWTSQGTLYITAALRLFGRTHIFVYKTTYRNLPVTSLDENWCHSHLLPHKTDLVRLVIYSESNNYMSVLYAYLVLLLLPEKLLCITLLHCLIRTKTEIILVNLTYYESVHSWRPFNTSFQEQYVPLIKLSH